MNIFASDICPVLSAQSLDDKRVGKLLMEANQLLTYAVMTHSTDWGPDDVGPGKLCKGSLGGGYATGGVAIWARQTSGNFDWLLCHAHALGAEFNIRFNKVHASHLRTGYIERFRNCLPDGPVLPFQNSARHEGLGIDFTHIDPPLSYRHYLVKRWQTDTMPVNFTARGEPSWLAELQAD